MAEKSKKQALTFHENGLVVYLRKFSFSHIYFWPKELKWEACMVVSL